MPLGGRDAEIENSLKSTIAKQRETIEELIAALEARTNLHYFRNSSIHQDDCAGCKVEKAMAKAIQTLSEGK